MFSCGGNAADSADSNAVGRHPSRFRIDSEGRCRECNAIGYAGVSLMQAKKPTLAREHRRQWDLAELDDRQRQGATEQRRVNQVVEQIIKAKPQCGCGRELGGTTANPACREENKRN